MTRSGLLTTTAWSRKIEPWRGDRAKRNVYRVPSVSAVRANALRNARRFLRARFDGSPLSTSLSQLWPAPNPRIGDGGLARERARNRECYTRAKTRWKISDTRTGQRTTMHRPEIGLIRIDFYRVAAPRSRWNIPGAVIPNHAIFPRQHECECECECARERCDPIPILLEGPRALVDSAVINRLDLIRWYYVDIRALIAKCLRDAKRIHGHAARIVAITRGMSPIRYSVLQNARQIFDGVRREGRVVSRDVPLNFYLKSTQSRYKFLYCTFGRALTRKTKRKWSSFHVHGSNYGRFPSSPASIWPT